MESRSQTLTKKRGRRCGCGCSRAVVEFTGREAELAELRSWCASGPARPARVLVGPGEVGNPCLAPKLAAEWQVAGRQRLLVALKRKPKR